jgi:hypothetical protein
MLLAKKHFAVNWVDGMKLTQQQFLDTDLHVQDLVRDATALPLTSYNYGLLPPLEGMTAASEIQLLEKIGDSVEVKLTHCNAVTAAGYRIIISADGVAGQNMTASFAIEKSETHEHPDFYTVLRVHPSERVPVGAADAVESPIRHPFTDARYSLEMLQTSRLAANKLGGYFLIIGRIVFINGSYQVDATFIPPCTSMDSHPQLVQYYKEFRTLLNQLQINSFKIVRQVHERQSPSPVARNMQQLCVKLLDYLAHTLFAYRNLSAQQPPVVVLSYFSSLANLLYTYLHCLPGRDREDLLAYFHEWGDVSPNTFEQLLRQLADLNYQHYQIGAAMQQVDKFARIIEGLWIKLSSLEYIGQRRENIVVYEESAAAPAAQPAERRRSLLD